jgi:hypothetical protein
MLSLCYTGITLPESHPYIKLCVSYLTVPNLSKPTLLANQQPLPLQPSQTIYIPTRFQHRLHRRLTQLPSLLRRLLLPARLCLTAPTRRHTRQDLATIMWSEVDEADITAGSGLTRGCDR